VRPTPLKRDPAKLREWQDRSRANARSRNATKRKPISPASPAQRRKVAELGVCLGCGREGSEWLAIDPAHLAPRSHGGCDHKNCVLPLCRAGDGSGCHRLFDTGQLDLLAVIAGRWPAELAELQHALTHLGPVPIVERLAGDRIEWRTRTDERRSDQLGIPAGGP
jgi:hypothetical protein